MAVTPHTDEAFLREVDEELRRDQLTSFWTRYRSDSQNPDLGDTLPQAVPGLAAGQFPAIPRSDDDLSPPDHLQAIANTAGFHFAWIEQGGTSARYTHGSKDDRSHAKRDDQPHPTGKNPFHFHL